MRSLDLAALPNEEEYETLAGFLMVMLRRVPRRTDRVDWGGYRFEVMDVDSYRIDQVLVTRMQGEAVVPHQQPHPASTLSAVATVAGDQGLRPIRHLRRPQRRRQRRHRQSQRRSPTQRSQPLPPLPRHPACLDELLKTELLCVRYKKGFREQKL